MLWIIERNPHFNIFVFWNSLVQERNAFHFLLWKVEIFHNRIAFVKNYFFFISRPLLEAAYVSQSSHSIPMKYSYLFVTQPLEKTSWTREFVYLMENHFHCFKILLPPPLCVLGILFYVYSHIHWSSSQKWEKNIFI